MQNQPEFQAVDGQLHRVVYQPVDQSSVETEVQAQVDAAQNALTQATQTREQAESTYVSAETAATAAEAAAEAASLDLDNAKKLEVEAEAAFQKSTASRDALANAKQLAAQQLEQSNAAEGDAADVDGDEDSEAAASEATKIPVTAA